MGEHVEHRGIQRRRIARKRPRNQTPETIGRQLLRIVVYDKRCRIGGTLTLDDLAEDARTFPSASRYMVDFGQRPLPRSGCSASVVFQGLLLLRGVPRLAGRPGRCPYSHHGGGSRRPDRSPLCASRACWDNAGKPTMYLFDRHAMQWQVFGRLTYSAKFVMALAGSAAADPVLPGLARAAH